MTVETHFRTCPLCEATCGLAIEVEDGEVRRIRGDREDVFSKGYLCPKGSTLKQLHEDPDRIRTPLVRGDDGELHPATWDEAFAEVERRLVPVLQEHGRDAVAVYLGNPNAHNLSALLYNRVLLRALGTTNLFSASTVDQRPKELSTGLLFGAAGAFAVPDLDRTDHLLLLGANPFASNGSLATAPDWPGRLERIVERGGTVVVVDPVRTRTAEAATEHVPIVPGTDALLLMAMVQVLFEEELVSLGRLADFTRGVDEVAAAAAAFTPEAVATATGIEADTIRRLARELAAAPTACVYGRIGTCTQELGTLASWLVDVLNVLTGNLDRPGGAMFSKPATGGPTTRGAARVGKGVTVGRRRSRVGDLPGSLGELPVAALAEEIETPGDGQVRALVVMGGNPALSAPNSDRLHAAFASLECVVAVDLYVNETTRHAHVLFPAPSALAKGHYDLAFYGFAIRNVANWSPPVLPLEDGLQDEWRTVLRLARIASGLGVGTDDDVDALDEQLARDAAERAGLDVEATMASLSPRTGPARLLDLLLRTGPYGLSLADLEAAPHGIDLGALEPRLPDALRTRSGDIELAPEPLLADVARMHDVLARRSTGGLVLVGRRHLRSNNSWMHNVRVLVKGRERCTLQVHPDDADRLGLGDHTLVTSRTGSVVAPVERTDALLPGVVSLPHGWGHDLPGVRLGVARERAGVNANVLADDRLYDALSGNAVLNGIPVEVAPAESPVGSGGAGEPVAATAAP